MYLTFIESARAGGVPCAEKALSWKKKLDKRPIKVHNISSGVFWMAANQIRTVKTISSEDPLELKLLEGKSAFEQTLAYKTLQEIRSLNESELNARTDIDTKIIEDTILTSFNDAYHILAKYEAKISHQDLMLCLYNYLNVTNNVAAFFLNSVSGTIRQRKNRLKGKLPENVYNMLFT